MDAYTLKALKGSIRKWEQIVEGTGIDKGPYNCPLCMKFNSVFVSAYQENCKGCPVAERSGRSACLGTPYEAWDARDESLDGSPENISLAEEELKFLRSLLPEETSNESN